MVLCAKYLCTYMSLTLTLGILLEAAAFGRIGGDNCFARILGDDLNFKARLIRMYGDLIWLQGDDSGWRREKCYC